MEKYGFFSGFNKNLEAVEQMDADRFIAKSIKREESLVINYAKASKMHKAQNLYSAKVLRFKVATDLSRLPENLLGCYMVDDGNLIKLKKAVKGCYLVYFDILEDYINFTGKNAVQTFLDELIAEQKAFRHVIVSNNIFPSQILWSNTIKREYEEKYREPILDKIALLFVDAKGSTRFKSRYFSLLQNLVTENFFMPLKNLTYANKAEFCGEMNCVLNPVSQVLPNVSLMPITHEFDRIILRCPKELADSDFIKKNAGILTNINKQKTVATVSFQDFLSMSLDEIKRLIDRFFANNINRVCIEHPEDMDAIERQKYNCITAYIKKLVAALYMGRRVCDVMLLYPSQAAAAAYTPIDTSRIIGYSGKIEKEIALLCKYNIPFDVGFEQALSEKIICDGAILSVEDSTYSHLVLPSCATISYNTANFIIEFTEKGGRVYTLGEKPHLIDGVKSERIEKLQSVIRNFKDDDLSALRPSFMPVINEPMVDVRAVKLSDASLMFFIANIRGASRCPTATFFTHDDIVNFDLVNLSERAAILQNKIGKITGRCVTALDYYEQGNSTFFRIVKDAAYENLRRNYKSLPLDDTFTVHSVTDNRLILDNCEWRISRGRWHSAKRFSDVLAELKARNKDFAAEFKFTLNISGGFLTDCVKLVYRDAEQFAFYVNGQTVDMQNGNADITNFVKSGANEIVLHADNLYKTLKTGIKLQDNISVVGDFAVKNNEDYTFSKGEIITKNSFALASRPDTVNSYKIRENGYWFFGGTIELTQKLIVEQKESAIYKVAFRDISAVYAEVSVNGSAAGILAFAPYEIDVSDFVIEGENDISVKFHALSALLPEVQDAQLHFKPFGGRLRDKEHAFINFDNVVKTYRDVTRDVFVLDSISFGVERGEFVVIAAPDGSGKTTILNILAGNSRYDSGRVKVDGEDLGEMNAVLLNNYRSNAAAFILADGNLINSMTVLENINAVLPPDNSANIMQILESVGILSLKNKFPCQLSLKERQCVALARALALDVKFILCDEPFGKMDYNAANEFLCILKNVCKSAGKTVIIATNNFAVADAADRVIKLKSGKISANTVNEHPVSPERIEW